MANENEIGREDLITEIVRRLGNKRGDVGYRWWDRIAGMVRWACVEPTIMAGCTVPLPCNAVAGTLRVCKAWPLSGSIVFVRTSDNRKCRLYLNVTSGTWRISVK